MTDPLRPIFEGLDQELRWGGFPIWKNPVDLIIFQEIAYEVQPTLVIETGTHLGGSAEFWKQITGGRVVTIDIDQRCHWTGEGILALEGSSTDTKVRAEVARHVRDLDVVLVNLDSSHDYVHVTAELDAYAEFVTRGSYLIVEDGIDDIRHRTRGARRACMEWLPSHPEFIADAYRERTGLTNCPGGFLKRIA